MGSTMPKRTASETRSERLLAFQRHLSSRLQVASTKPVIHDKRLGIICGESQLLIHLEDIAEIVQLPPIVSVPLMAPWYLGLVHVRGQLYGVMDYPQLCGAVPSHQNRAQKMLMFKPTAQLAIGMLVDQVLGVRVCTSTKEVRLPTPWLPGVTQVLEDENGQHWQAFSLAALINDTRVSLTAC
jgi:twitching motility protein PilI